MPPIAPRYGRRKCEGRPVRSGSPRPHSRGSAEAANPPYNQNGGRAKYGPQAARRSRRPNGSGAAASRRRTFIWALCRRARRTPHIAPRYGRRKCGELHVWSGSPPAAYRGFDGSRESPYKQNGGRATCGPQAARRGGLPNRAGAAASRRRAVTWALFRRARRMPPIAPRYGRRKCEGLPVRSGFPPAA